MFFIMLTLLLWFEFGLRLRLCAALEAKPGPCVHAV